MISTFCSGCGAKLIGKYNFSHFKPDTGQKLYTKKYICPNISWWNFLFHDSVKVFNGSFGNIEVLYTEEYIKGEHA